MTISEFIKMLQIFERKGKGDYLILDSNHEKVIKVYANEKEKIGVINGSESSVR